MDYVNNNHDTRHTQFTYHGFNFQNVSDFKNVLSLNLQIYKCLKKMSYVV